MKKIIIYTDGSCKKNPGLGGWAAVLLFQGYKKKIYGKYNVTTNNQMELVAIVNSLKYLKKPYNIKIITDSKYVKDGIKKCIYNWQKYFKEYNNSIKNIKLWKKLYIMFHKKKHKISCFWIKGHNFNKINIKIDNLSKKATNYE